LNPESAAYHGVLDPFYYEKAMGIIEEKIPDARIYFFSDDIQWVKQNLALNKHKELVSSHSRSAIEDFYLMTQCRHNIIANSSFSWWTAWLNDNPGKIVIAPEKWFTDKKIKTKDLIPQGWIRVG
jgi:hypothetical protein